MSRLPLRLAALSVALGTLAACDDGAKMSFLQPKDKAAKTRSASQSTQLVERDVEAPEVFQVTDSGLWDGRPSLGGVWVAHSDVTEPERVIIRNNANDKFVIGALFRREREIPGPRLQVSSDAAEALGMLAGAPVELNVTALKRETVEPEPTAEELEAETVSLENSGEITETTLDPIAGAAAAIDAAEPVDSPVKTAAAASAPAAAPAAPSQPSTSSLSKPYIQIGIFSVEANANRTADQMRNSGMIPTVFEQSLNDKPFWRVVVGPAQTKSERTALLGKVKEAGFSDAYLVSK